MVARMTEGPGGAAAEMLHGYQIVDENDQMLYAVEHFTQSHLLPATEGTLSAREVLTLPGNAVVERYVLKVTATAAARAHAATIAELRAEPGEVLGTYQIVVDFGTVRTVSAAVFDPLSTITMIEAWNGTEFPASTWDAPFSGSERLARFRSEVRTERLRITVTSGSSSAELMDGLYLVLPDSPKDLVLTINGGAPVWSLPGPAAAGSGSDLSEEAWNADGERLVDLTAAIAALTGDPLSPDARNFDVALTSREAGVLKIGQHVLDHAVVRRVTFNGADRTSLNFAAEGLTNLPLLAAGTPAGARARSIAFTASGVFGPERRLPAIGPDPALLDDAGGALVELDITPLSSVILRLEVRPDIPVLTGLRLPLATGVEGGELQLVAWQNTGSGIALPSEPMDLTLGDPLVADPSDNPVWSSLFLAEPLEIDLVNPPWFALVAARGKFTIALTHAGGADLRVGPTTGPWRPLPGLFQDAVFAGLRLPYRQIGVAADPVLTPPLAIAQTGAGTPPLGLDPIKGGTRLRLEGLDTLTPALDITHFTAGTIDIDTVDIVFDS